MQSRWWVRRNFNSSLGTCYVQEFSDFQSFIQTARFVFCNCEILIRKSNQKLVANQPDIEKDLPPSLKVEFEACPFPLVLNSEYELAASSRNRPCPVLVGDLSALLSYELSYFQHPRCLIVDFEYFRCHNFFSPF